MEKKVSELIDILEESIEIIKNEESDFEHLESKMSELNELVSSDSFKDSFEKHKVEKRTPLQVHIDKCNAEYSKNALVKEVLSLLPNSISLTKEEKLRVIEAIPRLENQQLSELINIFKEEKLKFEELEKEYEEDVKKLKKKRLSEKNDAIKPTKK